VKMLKWKWIAAVAVATGWAAFACGDEPDANGAKAPPPAQLTFGTLRAMPADTAKAKAAEWLKAKGKLDLAKFDAIWQVSDKPVMTRVLESITLGNPAAQTALDNARDAVADAPTEVPDVIKSETNAFVKTNLGAAYARGLAGKSSRVLLLQGRRGAFARGVSEGQEDRRREYAGSPRR
jgi:hypothetical protein